MNLRQLFCVHWFEVQTPHIINEGRGPYVCYQQRNYRVTYQKRTCVKCGLDETRELMAFCEGWD